MPSTAPTVTVPFEGQPLALSLPSGWEVVDTVRPRPLAALPDPAAALTAALERPIGCTPLERADLAGQRIVLALDDHGRPTPTGQFLPALVSWLRDRGAEPQRMTALFALGIHRDMTDAEAKAKLGAAGDLGIRWLNHRPRDLDAQVDLGVTRRGTPVRLNRHLHEADLVICVGLIEPHLLLGFGGGLKMILPGLAHESTIQRNHLQGVSPERYNYVGQVESPMRLDLEEAAGKLGCRIFVVNTVLGEGLQPARFLCGDPIAAHREGARIVAEACGRPVAGPVDVAIVASDPMNADLRQGMKCIGNVERSVKDDGLIVGLLECRSGIGDVAVPPRALPNRLLRFVLRRLGRGRVMWFIDKVKKGAGVEERFMAHFSMQVVREKQILVHSRRLPPDAGRRLGLFVQHPSPEALMAAARAYAPRRARVLVYPQGGITYPVLG